MNPLLLILGLVVLVAGRRLYWLFVAAVGFWVGSVLAHEHFGEAVRQWAVLIAVLGGIIGAVLALLFQKLAVALAGAAAGGFGGLWLLEAIGAESVGWLGMIIGAVLGGILVLRLFDWGLIAFSALTGAGMIVDAIPMEPNVQPWVFLAAVIVGVAVQATQLARARASKREAIQRHESRE
jgi:hypothetical protein